MRPKKRTNTKAETLIDATASVPKQPGGRRLVKVAMGQDDLDWHSRFDRSPVASVLDQGRESADSRPEFYWRSQENVAKRREKFRNRKQTLSKQ